MEYQKIANLIDDNTLNQPSKFRTRNWIEINDESRGVYNVNCQIKFKTTMLKSSLCDYSDAYILVMGTITVNNTAAQGAAANNTNKKVIFKNCARFTNCISEINNTQIDNAKDIDIVMPMYNLSFQGVNRLFVLAFENDNDRTSDDQYYFPTVEIKYYNIVINGENVFDQPIKNNKVTYDNIRKIAIGQGDDYTTGCLLDYPYFANTYKNSAVDLSKQQALDDDPRAIQQINFTANLDRAGNTRVYFILEEAKETILDFSQGTVKVL